MLQKVGRIVTKTWKKLWISHPLVWRWNTDRYQLLLSGDIHDHQLAQIDKDMVYKENEVKIYVKDLGLIKKSK